MLMAPAPSPKGTNIERLFVPAKWCSPVAAYDSVGGLLSDESLQTVLEILQDANLEPDLLAKLTDMFRTNSAMALGGRPRRAPASSEEAFLRRFPDAARIKQAW